MRSLGSTDPGRAAFPGPRGSGSHGAESCCAAEVRRQYESGTMDPVIAASQLSGLCRACGLCCDGSLFSHVGLEPAEVTELSSLGIPIKTLPSGARVLPQRCAKLEGRDCQIYPNRPSSCAEYKCELATSLLEERVSLPEAQAVVKKAQRLIAAGHARRFLRQRFRGRKGLD